MKCRFDCYIHIGQISSCSQNPDTFGTIICDLQWKGSTARVQCTLSNPSLQCCRRWKVDTKETTNSSILVARSKEGYQKNRLGTPVGFLYSHWSNQLVFTKSWYIRYHHLRPRMERLDTKSSMHTKQPFISSILPQFSIQKYQKHRL